MRVGIVFLLLLLTSTFHASLLDSMQYALPATIGLMVIALVILYMVSQSLSMPQLEAWVKLEIRELIVAAVLITLTYSIFTASNVTLATLSGKSNVQRATSAFFEERISTIDRSYADTIRAFHQIGILAGFSTSVGVPVFYAGGTFSGAPYSGFGMLMMPLSQAAQALSAAYFIYAGIKIIMDFLLTVAQPLLFLAYILRFIPFTRQIGSTFIALMLGASILMPFSVLLLAELHKEIAPKPFISPSDFDTTIAPPPPGRLPSDSLCANPVLRSVLNIGEIPFSVSACIIYALIPGVGIGAFSACFSLMTNVIYPLTVTGMTATYGAILIGLNYLDAPSVSEAYVAIFDFLAGITHLALLSYIDAIVIGMITIIGVKGISAALGGETFLGTIQRFV